MDIRLDNLIERKARKKGPLEKKEKKTWRTIFNIQLLNDEIKINNFFFKKQSQSVITFKTGVSNMNMRLTL